MELSDKYISKLTGKIPDQYLAVVRTELEILLSDYDISQKHTDIVPYDGRARQVLTYYLASARVAGKQPRTITHYRDVIERFLDAVGRPLGDIRTVDVRKYLYDLSCYGISSRTTENYRSILSGFFSFCVDEKYMTGNPCSRIKRIKFNPAEVEPLTDDQMERLRAACHRAPPNRKYLGPDDTVSTAGLAEMGQRRARELAIVEVLYGTGLRVSELIGLKLSDIDFVGNTVSVIKKGGAVHRPPISEDALAAISSYLAVRPSDSIWLFDSPRDPSSHVTRAAIERTVRILGDRAGIKGLHPHRIRHTTATKCLREGMPLEEVSKLLGHRSLNTTLIYASIDTESLKRHHREIL